MRYSIAVQPKAGSEMVADEHSYTHRVYASRHYRYPPTRLQALENVRLLSALT
jgi:hypothetical protein